MDKDKYLLNDFGFAPLVVDDLNKPYESLNNGDIKAWYSDYKFKAIIVNGKQNDGLDLRDKNGKEYDLLEIGSYILQVFLIYDEYILAEASKKIEIGKRENQLIGRFNPVDHKNRLIDWCKNNNVSIITDLIPGYLDSYLGTWLYHMGLLKMYRANDLCLFEDVNVKLFNYLIDETSTSYATELGYLQCNNKLNSRFDVFYYDLGEATIDDNKSKIYKFTDDEFGHICRIDVLKDADCENKYNLNRANVIKSLYGSIVEIKKDCDIAIMGIIKPIQLNPNDFILNDDNTYSINDYPETIRYRINDEIIDRKNNMERIDKTSIGKGVYEFYNIFHVKSDLNIHIDCVYKKGIVTPIGDIEIKVL